MDSGGMSPEDERWLQMQHAESNRQLVIKLQARVKELEEQIVSMTHVDIHAAPGEPLQANAVFEGHGVRVFAESCIAWFRREGGQNFVTCTMTDRTDGTRYEITMQRCGGKTPAQTIGELRAELAATGDKT